MLFHRNGPEFEARIRQNEINNPKFNFLNPNDPYHAYYRHKVTEFKEGKGQEPSAAVPKVMQQQAMQQSQQQPQKVQKRIHTNYFTILKVTSLIIRFYYDIAAQDLKVEGVFFRAASNPINIPL